MGLHELCNASSLLLVEFLSDGPSMPMNLQSHFLSSQQDESRNVDKAYRRMRNRMRSHRFDEQKNTKLSYFA